jgi:hypothetical protein
MTLCDRKIITEQSRCKQNIIYREREEVDKCMQAFRFQGEKKGDERATAKRSLKRSQSEKGTIAKQS